jgi:hypothetical protein
MEKTVEIWDKWLFTPEFGTFKDKKLEAFFSR